GAHSVGERRWHPTGYRHITHPHSPGESLPHECNECLGCRAPTGFSRLPVGAHSVGERRWHPTGYRHITHPHSPGDRAPAQCFPNPGNSLNYSAWRRAPSTFSLLLRSPTKRSWAEPRSATSVGVVKIPLARATSGAWVTPITSTSISVPAPGSAPSASRFARAARLKRPLPAI